MTDSTARLVISCNDPEKPELATSLVHGVNFGKDAESYNVTDVRVNYCQISSATNPNVRKKCIINRLLLYIFKKMLK